MLMRVLLSISVLGCCATSTSQNSTRTLGNKSYEVSNHLGNVMTVVSDRKTPTTENTNTTIAFNETDITSFNDYYPYGMLLDNRNGSSNYRFGFQGQEKDDEVKDKNNTINYKFRAQDPRLGRFFAVDPLSTKYPHNSTYAFSENNVIHAVELEGLEKRIVVNEIWIEGVHIGSQISKNQYTTDFTVKEDTYYIVKNEVNSDYSFDQLKRDLSSRYLYSKGAKINNKYSPNYFMNATDEEISIFKKTPLDYSNVKSNEIKWVSSKYTIRSFYENDQSTSTIEDTRDKMLMKFSNILKNTTGIQMNINVSAFASDPASNEYNQELTDKRVADMKANLIAQFKSYGVTDEQLNGINWTENSNSDNQTTGTENYDRRSTADITFTQRGQ